MQEGADSASSRIGNGVPTLFVGPLLLVLLVDTFKLLRRHDLVGRQLGRDVAPQCVPPPFSCTSALVVPDGSLLEENGVDVASDVEKELFAAALFVVGGAIKLILTKETYVIVETGEEDELEHTSIRETGERAL